MTSIHFRFAWFLAETKSSPILYCTAVLFCGLVYQTWAPVGHEGKGWRRRLADAVAIELQNRALKSL